MELLWRQFMFPPKNTYTYPNSGYEQQNNTWNGSTENYKLLFVTVMKLKNVLY